MEIWCGMKGNKPNGSQWNTIIHLVLYYLVFVKYVIYHDLYILLTPPSPPQRISDSCMLQRWLTMCLMYYQTLTRITLWDKQQLPCDILVSPITILSEHVNHWVYTCDKHWKNHIIPRKPYLPSGFQTPMNKLSLLPIPSRNIAPLELHYKKHCHIPLMISITRRSAT